MVAFKKSPQAKALKKEMLEFKTALEHNVKVTDLPKNFEEDKDEEKLYLFWALCLWIIHKYLK